MGSVIGSWGFVGGVAVLVAWTLARFLHWRRDQRRRFALGL